MQEINLSDLPKNKVYVLLERKTRYLLFDKFFKKFRRKRDIADFLKFGDGYSMNRYKNGLRHCPLWLLVDICNVVNVNLNSLQNKIESIKYGTNGKAGVAKLIKKPKFPIKLSYNTSYLIAKLIGDGHLSYNKRGSIQCSYRNNDKLLKKEFINSCKKLFGGLEYRDDGKSIHLPSICGLIFYQFNENFMSDSSSIPKSIVFGEKNILIGFLRAIFEDEGCVPKNCRCILIAMANKKIIYQIHTMLQKIDIYPSNIKKIVKKGKRKVQYGFGIYGRNNLICFYEKIGFTDKYYKDKILLNHIKSYKFKQNRINETSNIILNLFKTSYKLSTHDICDILNMKKSNVLYNLNRLEKQNKISREVRPPMQNSKGLLLGNRPHKWFLMDL